MRKVKILLVEDEAITALLLTRNLKQEGYEVCDPVSTGEAAIRAVKNDHPDVILMDIRLGSQMDGVEAAQTIANSYDIPIIFLTGYGDKETIARAEVVNPAGYLIKPVTPADVAPLLAALFQ